MMEDDGAGGRQQERAEGNRVDEGGQMTTDLQSTIDGCGKGGQGCSCEGMNGAIYCHVDNGGGSKVGGNGRAVVDN